VGSQSKSGVESRHRIETSIESKYKFVEIRLQVVGANAVMRSEQPRLEV
jgi:hypothetical protein